MGGNICNICSNALISKIYQKFIQFNNKIHITQFKNRQRPTNGLQIQEKMLNLIVYKGNANKSHNITHLTSVKMVITSTEPNQQGS